jgi:hypothetical protein
MSIEHITFWSKPENRSKVGRPKLRWLEDVKRYRQWSKWASMQYQHWFIMVGGILPINGLNFILITKHRLCFFPLRPLVTGSEGTEARGEKQIWMRICCNVGLGCQRTLESRNICFSKTMKCDAMWSGRQVPTFQRNLLLSSEEWKVYDLPGSFACWVYSSTLKIEVVCSSETPVNFFQTT